MVKEEHKMIKKQVKAYIALLLVTLVWGVSFTVIKDALAVIGPYYFNGIRFTKAFVFLALLYWKRIRKVNGKTLSAGLMMLLPAEGESRP